MLFRSVVCASNKVSRARSLDGRGKVRKRGDVDWLPEAEAIIRYLDSLMSQVHPIEPKSSRSSLARSLLVVGHPLVCVSGKVLEWSRSDGRTLVQRPKERPRPLPRHKQTIYRPGIAASSTTVSEARPDYVAVLPLSLISGRHLMCKNIPPCWSPCE